jgi:uncharacterized protein
VEGPRHSGTASEAELTRVRSRERFRQLLPSEEEICEQFEPRHERGGKYNALAAPARSTPDERSAMQTVSMLWRRLDTPGHESARLTLARGRWRLAGTAVFAQDARPCRLDYTIVCDRAWRTLSATVAGWLGSDAVRVEIAADAAREWRLDGAACPAVAGCLDVDLSFSPSTNFLALRRLGLAVGQAAEVRAAWLRFPDPILEPLDQVYRRDGPSTYRYESAGGFATDLEVSEAGFVTRYPDLWEVEPASPAR